MVAPRMCDLDDMRVSNWASHDEHMRAAYDFVQWYTEVRDDGYSNYFQATRIYLQSIFGGEEYKALYARYLVEKSL